MNPNYITTKYVLVPEPGIVYHSSNLISNISNDNRKGVGEEIKNKNNIFSIQSSNI